MRTRRVENRRKMRGISFLSDNKECIALMVVGLVGLNPISDIYIILIKSTCSAIAKKRNC